MRQGNIAGFPPVVAGLLGPAGSDQAALADADVVLLVGSEVAAGDHFLAKLEITGDIIRIDIDPTELTSMYSAAVPIQADARAAMLPVVGARQVQAGGTALAGREPGPRDSRAQCRENDQLERLHARVWKSCVRPCRRTPS